MQSSSTAIMNAAAEFLWSEELQRASDTFVSTQAHLFTEARIDGEQRLEWQQIYLACAQCSNTGRTASDPWKMYTLPTKSCGPIACTTDRQLYESALEDFCAAHGISADGFVEACQDALQHSEWAEHRGMAECILAMAGYEYFLKMMSAAVGDEREEPEGRPSHTSPADNPRREDCDDLDAFM